jgi:hypothetical protein
VDEPTRRGSDGDRPHERGRRLVIRLPLASAEELRKLPDGTILTSPRPADRLVWLRVYGHPHLDPDTGLWTLPRNPFAEWQVQEIAADLPDEIEATQLTGDESWLSTLDDPHDTTQHHDH